MNTASSNLNPASAVLPQSAAGKPQEPGSDTPFSAVLSSEIAQNRHGKKAAADDKSEKSKDDPSLEAGSATADPSLAVKQPQTAAEFELLRAGSQPVVPGFLPGLAIPSDQAATDSTIAEEDLPTATSAQSATLLAGHEQRKAPLLQALQAALHNNAKSDTQTRDVQQPATGRSNRTAIESAGSKAAPGIANPLMPSQMTDVKQSAESFTDLLTNPMMRAGQQGPIEAPTPQSGAASSKLAPSVGTTAWGQALGDRVIWMAAGGQQTASLTLNPPNLGPLQIVLNLSNEQVTASFFSAQPEVRQALEAAFPRLREMMSESGIQLGQTSVSADTPQQQAADHQFRQANRSFASVENGLIASGSLDEVQVRKAGRGLVDTFA